MNVLPLLLDLVLTFAVPTIDCAGNPLSAPVDSYHVTAQQFWCMPTQQYTDCTPEFQGNGDFPADPTADIVQMNIGGIDPDVPNMGWYWWRVTGVAGAQNVCPDASEP